MASVPAKAFSREFHSGGHQFQMKTTIESVQNGWVVECLDENTPRLTKHVFQSFPDLLAALPELLNEYRLEPKDRQTFDDLAVKIAHEYCPNEKDLESAIKSAQGSFSKSGV